MVGKEKVYVSWNGCLRLIFMFLGSMLLVSCTAINPIRIPLNGTPLSNDQATVIIWMDQEPNSINGYLPIAVNGRVVGKVSPSIPLKFASSPGYHRIHTISDAADHVNEVDFKPGEVYFYRLWKKHGFWTSGYFISPTTPSRYYDNVNP